MLMQERARTGLRPATALFSTAILAEGECLAHTRRAVRAWLAVRDVAAEEADTTVLMVNELITNAQQHARGSVRLRLFLRCGLLRCEVLDACRTRPQLEVPGVDDEGGRGLQLVDALALLWGSFPAGRGKVVWFELLVATTPLDI